MICLSITPSEFNKFCVIKVMKIRVNIPILKSKYCVFIQCLFNPIILEHCAALTRFIAWIYLSLSAPSENKSARKNIQDIYVNRNNRSLASSVIF